jgi:hypothetical protein
MKNMTHLQLALATLAATQILGSFDARAAVISQDDFNSYTPAAALTGGVGGTGWGANNWLAPSASTTLATVNNYSGDNKVDVSMTSTATTVAAGRLVGTPITQTFYAGFVVSYFGDYGTNVFSGNNTFGLILSDLTTPNTTVAANVLNFGLRGGANAFGIRGGTAAAGNTTGGALSPNTDYLLVAKLTYSGGKFDKGDLWVNPGASLVDEIAPGATLSLTAGTGVGVINSVYFRQAANQVGDIYTMNNLILATDWNDIVPIPEPASASLLLVGGALWLVSRRGRRNVVD